MDLSVIVLTIDVSIRYTFVLLMNSRSYNAISQYEKVMIMFKNHYLNALLQFLTQICPNHNLNTDKTSFIRKINWGKGNLQEPSY